ncbi:hypothetical protein [Desulforhopalus sp. IMCC35007]|uniref:hypothetical protein n=1 Tax=Desulforhopalus sp. IMCC35007 TaxID=2569543 RepID=UPI0010AE8E89|nr:hypothetical protein [Desulforhopalus sp. IMCC35007]TKB07309.1 hypothetical protein FCL48_17715 [Desulforhopalus sp. IMCC35007]
MDSLTGQLLGIGTVLCWTLHYLSAGVAARFFSLVPICIIPFAIFYQKEPVSIRAIAGADGCGGWGVSVDPVTVTGSFIVC